MYEHPRQDRNDTKHGSTRKHILDACRPMNDAAMMYIHHGARRGFTGSSFSKTTSKIFGAVFFVVLTVRVRRFFRVQHRFDKEQRVVLGIYWKLILGDIRWLKCGKACGAGARWSRNDVCEFVIARPCGVSADPKVPPGAP